jgi:hypothetical protein
MPILSTSSAILLQPNRTRGYQVSGIRYYRAAVLALCLAQHLGQRHSRVAAPDGSTPRNRRHPCWELIKV